MVAKTPRPSSESEIAQANEIISATATPPTRRDLPIDVQQIQEIVLETGSATIAFDGDNRDRQAVSERARLIGHLTNPRLPVRHLTFTIINGERDPKLVIKGKER